MVSNDSVLVLYFRLDRANPVSAVKRNAKPKNMWKSQQKSTGRSVGKYQIILHSIQWRKNGVAAASSDGGPTGGMGPSTVLEFLVINFRVPDLRKWRGPRMVALRLWLYWVAKCRNDEQKCCSRTHADLLRSVNSHLGTCTVDLQQRRRRLFVRKADVAA